MIVIGYEKADAKNGCGGFSSKKSKSLIYKDIYSTKFGYAKVKTKKRNHKIDFSRIMQQNLLALAFSGLLIFFDGKN